MFVKPTFTDILKAKIRIAPYLTKTPLLEYPLLSDALGFEAFVKHENYQPTGAFKIRGGINLIGQLSSEEKKRGVITASTGNHGQSIALACKMFGVDAIVCVQDGANPVKVGGIRSYGAKIIEKGKDFDEARENAERLSKEKSYRYVHSANEPLLISGVGTVGLEIIEDLPDLDAVIVPVGGGTQASGICTCFKTVAPDVEIIAVQSTHAPSVYNSWKSGKLESTNSANTMADGLATRIAFELPLKMLWELLDDFVLVTDDEIESAIKMYVEKAHTIAEGAGAASLAAAIKISERLQNKKVVLILSGGNLPADILRKIL
jgi:threonine dehydratase